MVDYVIEDVLHQAFEEDFLARLRKPIQLHRESICEVKGSETAKGFSTLNKCMCQLWRKALADLKKRFHFAKQGVPSISSIMVSEIFKTTSLSFRLSCAEHSKC